MVVRDFNHHCWVSVTTQLASVIPEKTTATTQTTITQKTTATVQTTTTQKTATQTRLFNNTTDQQMQHKHLKKSKPGMHKFLNNWRPTRRNCINKEKWEKRKLCWDAGEFYTIYCCQQRHDQQQDCWTWKLEIWHLNHAMWTMGAKNQLKLKLHKPQQHIKNNTTATARTGTTTTAQTSGMAPRRNNNISIFSFVFEVLVPSKMLVCALKVIVLAPKQSLTHKLEHDLHHWKFRGFPQNLLRKNKRPLVFCCVDWPN